MLAFVGNKGLLSLGALRVSWCRPTFVGMPAALANGLARRPAKVGAVRGLHGRVGVLAGLTLAPAWADPTPLLVVLLFWG